MKEEERVERGGERNEVGGVEEGIKKGKKKEAR